MYKIVSGDGRRVRRDNSRVCYLNPFTISLSVRRAQKQDGLDLALEL